MAREIALAIGVGDARGLPYLSGAINGARAFGDWASKMGYESHLLLDEDSTKPVTVDVLCSTLEGLLKGTPIHRLILYFAGHGLIREAEQGMWLLSDWRQHGRGVAIEVLKRRLYYYGIEQIAIISDCCRSLATKMETSDLTEDGVIGFGPQPRTEPPIDKFIAAQDGSESFMIPGKDPVEDRCLFSGLLLEALWGTKPEAFSKLAVGKITSGSLAGFLRSAVPALAKKYSRELAPSVSTNFPEEDNVYFGIDPNVKAPTFPDWPPPGTVIALGPGDRIQPIRTALEILQSTEVEQIEIPPPRVPLLDRIQSQPRPGSFETGSGFAIEGAPVAAVWTAMDVVAEQHGEANWWRVRNGNIEWLGYSSPVLIEFADGLFAAVTAMPRFIATVLREGDVVSALIYRQVHEPRDTAAMAENAIAQMEAGSLRANASQDLTVELRKAKHADPTLGVISAYLYDSIGDVDSIRRMAYFYTWHGQPIPYDIAMLGQLEGFRQYGRLWAKVPAVKERKPRSDAERANEWTYQATPGAEGEVGGAWPWMRQGWALLDHPDDLGSTLIAPELIGIRDYLRPGRFAMLDSNGASIASNVFKLVRYTL